MMDHVVQWPPARFLERVAGQPLGSGVHVGALLLIIHQEDGDAGIVQNGVQPPLDGFLRADRFSGRRDVDTLGEDTGYLTFVIEDRLVNKAEEPDFLMGRAAVKPDRDAFRRVALSRAVNLIQQGDKALFGQFRKRDRHGQPNQVSLADKRAIGGVGHPEYVPRPFDHGDATRSTLH